MSPVDMSDAAVTRRLRQASELRRLCISLGQSRKIPLEHAESDATNTATADRKVAEARAVYGAGS